MEKTPFPISVRAGPHILPIDQKKVSPELSSTPSLSVRNWSAVFIATLAAYHCYAYFAEQIFSSNVSAGALFAVLSMGLMLFVIFYFTIYARISNWCRPMKPVICSLYEQPFWDQERFWKLNDNPLVEIFAGSPIKNLISRCQGVKMGKQVFDNGCGYSEPYMVEIGDYCTFNQKTGLQGHSLEDGIFKSDVIRVGDRCTLGVASFVHYGSVIGDDVDIRTDAFVMKGTIIGNGEVWTGNPAQLMTSEQDFNGEVQSAPAPTTLHINEDCKSHAA